MNTMAPTGRIAASSAALVPYDVRVAAVVSRARVLLAAVEGR